MAYVVGVTGGIGSGKTTVANLFAEKGIEVIDADVIARQVVEPGSEGLKAIEEKFGAFILNDDGTLNRGALREHVFSHPEDKDWLNGLLHPKIRQEMITQTAQAKSLYCLLVIPLLVENSLQSLCQRVLVVDVSEATQVTRTTQRDQVSPEQVKNILAAQATRQQRLEAADDVIFNENDSKALSEQIETLHHQYLDLAAQ
ncbi:dephospho-CoA kinase [Grimontia sp. NTOU-MAR1]|uniref:dephospho-CoA kinase n=1 Tax=Grimontia sp. NTOU-MAR1 TaxID=3111011 RepID=UPI002DBC562D|nr:dephospho-CoA kinase [Grimontia sp. NTOU-MAR1]WRV97070.1 dephospho-CoA kinase [Grimontia sp. NTOU-MAR1]